MENIRAYCEYIDLYFQSKPNQEKQDNYTIEQNKCLDAVSNKLLSMDEANKKCYVKMIADYFEGRASIDFDLLNAFMPDDDRITKEDVRKEIEETGEILTDDEINLVWESAKQRRIITDDATSCVAELVWKIFKLFAFCGIDMNQYLEIYAIPYVCPVQLEHKANTSEDKTQKLGAPSVKTRILLIKTLVNHVYPGFGKLDDTEQMRFINCLTGIDKDVKSIYNGSIKQAFSTLKRIENGLDTESKAVDSYNKMIDEASSILEGIGIDKLSIELKKKKIS